MRRGLAGGGRPSDSDREDGDLPLQVPDRPGRPGPARLTVRRWMRFLGQLMNTGTGLARPGLAAAARAAIAAGKGGGGPPAGGWHGFDGPPAQGRRVAARLGPTRACVPLDMASRPLPRPRSSIRVRTAAGDDPGPGRPLIRTLLTSITIGAGPACNLRAAAGGPRAAQARTTGPWPARRRPPGRMLRVRGGLGPLCRHRPSHEAGSREPE